MKAMTLTEVIQQLCNIRNRVTNTGFETNIESIDAHIEGDWKDWRIDFHLTEETEKDAFEQYLESLNHDQGIKK